MDAKGRLLSRLVQIKQELFHITRLPDFNKTFKKHKYDLRRLTAEVVHRTNNIVGEQNFVNLHFKNKFRQESLFGLSLGNKKQDFEEVIDSLDNLIEAINLDKNSKVTFINNPIQMNLSPSRFAIPIYLITIISVLIFHLLNIPWYYVTFVFVSSALLIALIATIELRNNDKLTEPSFNALFVKVLKSILIFRKIDGNN